MANRPPSLIAIDYVFANRSPSLRRRRMPTSIRHNPKAQKTSRGRWSHSIEHLRTEARKSIWFAFQTLLGPQSDKVQIHTLKVLTASLGNALGIERSEDLHNQTEQTELDFESYFELLETLMFEPLSKASDETMDLSSIDYQHVHSVCWVLFYNHDKGKTLPDDIPENIAFKMWMLFNLFCEEDDSGTPLFPLKIDPEEATIIFDSILTQTGKKEHILSEAVKGLGDEPVLYQRYIAVFFVHILKNTRETILKSSVEMVFEQLVYDILKKGSMSKRGHQVKTWKERYMVLNPTELKYYVSSHQKHLKGTIVFDKSVSIEQLPDKGGKRNLFVLNTPHKPYEMSAIDQKTKNEWISAIQVAIDNSENPHYHHHKELAKARRLRRNQLRQEKAEEERRRREEEENFKRIEEEHRQKDHMNQEKLEEYLKKLEDEKRARAELEEKLREQEALRELERKRLMELEALNAELERLLELERQAKRDEETVRKLQATLLEEESEKREELERLKREQEELLKEEREKREGLEGEWEEKEKNLAEATAKLMELENEREEASLKLQEAAEKLQEAEKERLKMEEKVKLWKTPNIGLARPIQPKYQTPVTHRGKGAFCEADFLKKARKQDKERGLSKAQLDEMYPNISDASSDEENGLKSPKRTSSSQEPSSLECTTGAESNPSSPSVLKDNDSQQGGSENVFERNSKENSENDDTLKTDQNLHKLEKQDRDSDKQNLQENNENENFDSVIGVSESLSSQEADGHGNSSSNEDDSPGEINDDETQREINNGDNVASRPYENVTYDRQCHAECGKVNDNVRTSDSEIHKDNNKTENVINDKSGQSDSGQDEKDMSHPNGPTNPTGEDSTSNSEMTDSKTNAFNNELYSDMSSEDLSGTNNDRNADSDVYENVEVKRG